VSEHHDTPERLLYLVARLCRGMSGRGLRKLPVKAHAYYLQRPSSTLVDFLSALRATVVSELASSGPQGVFD
jgi:hypothetical protein